MESEGIPWSEIRDKIMEYFNVLPDSEKKEWNEKYKKLCMEWVETVSHLHSNFEKLGAWMVF